jgi:hypothetical protein
MPRKAADTDAEPRRSSRIKELPKSEAPVKAAPKPRAKKEPKVAGEEGDKPKRGRKRKEAPKDDGEDADDAEAPAAKKVRIFFFRVVIWLLTMCTRPTGQARQQTGVQGRCHQAREQGCCETLEQGQCEARIARRVQEASVEGWWSCSLGCISFGGPPCLSATISVDVGASVLSLPSAL